MNAHEVAQLLLREASFLSQPRPVNISIPGTDVSVHFMVTDVATWKKELDEHRGQESGEPTEEQRAQTALYSRAFFLVAFGEKEFKRLDLTDEERKAARALADRYRNR